MALTGRRLYELSRSFRVAGAEMSMLSPLNVLDNVQEPYDDVLGESMPDNRVSRLMKCVVLIRH